MDKMHQTIQHAAFEMFRDWTIEALERFPNMDFTIVDETGLVDDTKDAITKALRSLFSSEHKEERKDKGWCIGFVQGYVQGNLAAKWFHKYYQTQTDNYRYMMAVKSIIEYTKVDSDLSWRLDNIYKELFKLCVYNLEHISHHVQIDTDFREKHDLANVSKKGLVMQALHSLTDMFAKKMIDVSSFRLPDKHYFSREDLQYLINNHEKCQNT